MEDNSATDYTGKLMQAIADISRQNHQPIPRGPLLDQEWRDFDQRRAESNYLLALSKSHDTFIETVYSFQQKFGSKPHPEDKVYTRFTSLVKVILKNAGDNMYEDIEFDSNMVYIMAILGLLHPVHIPKDLSMIKVVSGCLDKHKPQMIDGAIERKIHGDDIRVYLSREHDTLYYYLLYVFYQENAEHYGYQYFRNKNLHYRSGGVYHLLSAGCRLTDRCLDIIFGFQSMRDGENESERATDMLKDFIFTSSESSSIECRITKYLINHGYQTEAPWMCGPMFASDVESLQTREIFSFWEVANLDIFCRHHLCLDLEHLPHKYNIVSERMTGVIKAMTVTIKSLKNLCRLAIRRSFDSSKVVSSCKSFTQIPPKLRSYLAFESFNAPIRSFYSLSDMPGELPTRHVYDATSDIQAVKNEVLSAYHLPNHYGNGF